MKVKETRKKDTHTRTHKTNLHTKNKTNQKTHTRIKKKKNVHTKQTYTKKHTKNKTKQKTHTRIKKRKKNGETTKNDNQDLDFHSRNKPAKGNTEEAGNSQDKRLTHGKRCVRHVTV